MYFKTGLIGQPICFQIAGLVNQSSSTNHRQPIIVNKSTNHRQPIIVTLTCATALTFNICSHLSCSSCTKIMRASNITSSACKSFNLRVYLKSSQIEKNVSLDLYSSLYFYIFYFMFEYKDEYKSRLTFFSI